MRKTVYHPKTGEGFELLESKANRLILEHGWTQSPIDPAAEPAVQEVVKPKRGRKPLVIDDIEPAEEWRGSFDEDDGFNEDA